MLQTL